MIPKECKRLAEVDFPIAVVSKHAAREKSIRHGHPSTLHLWWARRPLAACRAMLMALLLPDPCDEHCPAAFREQARQWLLNTRGKIGSDHLALRQALLKFIGDFANWDLSSDATYLEVARGLVHAAHPDEPPLVVDPFAGGGSIPLEALRVGCEAFASDLNPVACLILKVLLEDMPRKGPDLAGELRRVGASLKTAAQKEFGKLYPAHPDGAKPIAYLWARTVRCESPNCGAEIPLVRSFWLSKKAKRLQALRYRVVRPKGKPPYLEFQVFEPRRDRDVPSGTISRAKAICPCCSDRGQTSVLSPDRVRMQLGAQRGGADTIFDAQGKRVGGARLLAVVTVKPGEQGRHYELPTDRDISALLAAHRAAGKLSGMTLVNGLTAIPQEKIPRTELRRISVPIYGIEHWCDAFTERQIVALHTLFEKALAEATSPELRRLLALALSRSVNAMNTICRWHLTRENIEGAYSRQALGMVWDFCEANPASESTGSFLGAIEWIAAVMERNANCHRGQMQQADAAASPQPSEAAQIWFTDPPYYDSIPYSHLSDFVYVWLRRFLGPDRKLGFHLELTPKQQECVVDRPHSANPSAKDRDFFEAKMADAMREGRRLTVADGIGSVVFAHKTTEGWEALLSGIWRSGWTITASWPVATEMGERLNARDTASLATSVHLVCRPRPEHAPVGDWAKVLRELPPRVAEWMERLQAEGVRGADLVFACIGPALEIYSRYAKVVDAEEREIPLGGDPEAREPHRRGYLAYVWEVVGRTALEQVLGSAESTRRNGPAGSLEEDSRLTALFLWTLQSTATEEDQHGGTEDTEGDEESEDEDEAATRGKAKGFSLMFDVVRRFAQPLGIHLPDWEGRIIETEKGIVRLIPPLARGEQLFGEEGAEAVADRIENVRTGPVQLELFPQSDEQATPMVRGRRRRASADISDESLQAHRGATTLDRVHAAMILQASGRSHALRGLLKSELERGPDFLRLANALSALYPTGSDEKRLIDAMLLAVPR